MGVGSSSYRQVLPRRLHCGRTLSNDDPGLNPNCPKCPRPLRYVMSAGGSHFYECPEHGGWRLQQDGDWYPMDSVDAALDALRKSRDEADPPKT